MSAFAKSRYAATERRTRNQIAILDFARNLTSFMLETASEAMTAIAVAGPRNHFESLGKMAAAERLFSCLKRPGASPGPQNIEP